MLALLFCVPVQAQTINETAAEGRYGSPPSPASGRGNEGEGETARLISINRNNTATGRSLPRESPVPGGIVILPISPDTDPAPVVHYDNQRVLVVPHAGKWQAVVGLPLTLAPGTGSVRLPLPCAPRITPSSV